LIRELSITILNEAGEKVKIPIIYGSQERAIAKIKQDKNLVLPLMSIHIADIEETSAHRKPRFIVENFTYFEIDSKRAFRVVRRAPKAVTLNYRLVMWTKYTEDMNQIMESLQLLFQPYLNLNTISEDKAIATLADIMDMSAHQVGDKQDRIIRKQAFIQSEAYLPNKAYLYSSDGVLTSFVSQSGSTNSDTAETTFTVTKN